MRNIYVEYVNVFSDYDIYIAENLEELLNIIVLKLLN